MIKINKTKTQHNMCWTPIIILFSTYVGVS